jgi:hypothetical protein
MKPFNDDPSNQAKSVDEYSHPFSTFRLLGEAQMVTETKT